MNDQPTPSKASLWTGRIISVLVTLFLLFDSIMKIIEAKPSVEGSVQLGWPADAIQGLGVVLLVCTILYAIPRTSILGAIFLTGYLGGAVAVMFRAGLDGHPYIFPIVFGILSWAGIFLQEIRLRALLPLKK